MIVLHSQQRRLGTAGRPAILAIALGYGGHGANGEYAGSKLEGARQLLARLRYKHPWGSIELMNLQNRRRLGAHAGVQPLGSDFNTIYNRFSATVRNPNAQRRDLRNDLVLTARARIVPGFAEPLALTGYWTARTFRYTDAVDLQARTSRLGYRIAQSFGTARARATIHIEGWSEGLRDDSTALGDSIRDRRGAVHASLEGALRRGSWSATASAGWHRDAGDGYAAGRLRVERAGRGFGVYAEASYTGRTPSWVESHGWGPTLLPAGDANGTRIALARAGAHIDVGPFDLSVEAFAHRVEHAVDLFPAAGADTVQVRRLGTPVRQAGLTAGLGFRRTRDRGFYLSVTPTLYRFDDPGASPEHRMLSRSLPEAYVLGRTGLRYLLFRGDLDMDLYARGRLWSPFLSRTMHPETGLLVVRADGDREVEASAALDVVLEAGVRTAKFFLAFENLLSGTSLVPGNMLVPVYPLPARRFRFGVFWPIQD